MGLTKQYLRYVPGPFFNVIASPKCNVAFVNLNNSQPGRYVAVGACAHVFVWDLRLQLKIHELRGEEHEATVLCPNPNGNTLAVGYLDGAIRIFDLRRGDCLVTLHGHKSGITALAYGHSGLSLVSGSKDTTIVMWDTVSELGLFKLLGHKGPITQVQFMKEHDILVSSSKDCLVKFWHLDTRHCFKTLVGHRSEVWDFVIVKNDTRLITGCSDSELRVWQLDFLPQEGVPPVAKKQKMNEETEEEEEEDDIFRLSKMGSILRKGRDRVSSLVSDPSDRMIACHGAGAMVELFLLCDEEQVQKRFLKRAKKERKKANKNTEDEEKETEQLEVSRSLRDEVMRLLSVKASGKVKGLALHLDKANSAKVLTLLNNNSVEVHSMDVSDKETEATVTASLAMDGHRTDVRTVCFSSDNTAMLSASSESIKIWNRLSRQCIRTIECGYALCSMFVPGDRHAILGTKEGKLQIFDIPAAQRLEEVEAHEGEAWSIAVMPDKRGFVSGGADKMVKFWDFDVSNSTLSVLHTRTLKLDEGVLCVRITANHKLLAVSLLDSTVKIFFVDTLKFFLSLYGHKLPVLCMDTSTDSTLIVTGGADRHVKIWSLNFGECLGSVFAHDDSVMGLHFIPKTHMFFSCGKDGKVKQWDADRKGIKILTLEGHHHEVWSLCVSPNGIFVLSCGHDGSLRLWERTMEPLVLEDEREEERAKMEDRLLATGEDQATIPGEAAGKEVERPTRKTLETERAAERLMEGLDVYKEYSVQLKEHEVVCAREKKELPTPPVPPLMAAYDTTTPEHFILEVLKKIKSSELEESLLVLPFSYVESLLRALLQLLSHGWEVELSSRCLFFLLRVHGSQVVANHTLLPVIDQLRQLARLRVTHIKDTVGLNLAGLCFLERMVEEREAVQLFQDAVATNKDRKRKRKKKENAQHRLILQQ